MMSVDQARTQDTSRSPSGPDMRYVDHPLFHRPDACDLLFEQAEPIPQPTPMAYAVVPSDPTRGSIASTDGPALLTVEQEKTIFLQYNYARFRVNKLRQMAEANPLDASEQRTLTFWYDTALRLRAQIVEFNMGLVPAMTKTLRARPDDLDELICEGNAVLLKTVEKFDVQLGFKFSTYACGSILRAVRRLYQTLVKRRRLQRLPDHDAWEPASASDPLASVERAEHLTIMRRVLERNEATLTRLERDVITLRYPLMPGSRRRPTLRDVAALTGYSRERVRQVEHGALRKLKTAMMRHLND